MMNLLTFFLPKSRHGGSYSPCLLPFPRPQSSSFLSAPQFPLPPSLESPPPINKLNDLASRLRIPSTSVQPCNLLSASLRSKCFTFHRNKGAFFICPLARLARSSTSLLYRWRRFFHPEVRRVFFERPFELEVSGRMLSRCPSTLLILSPPLRSLSLYAVLVNSSRRVGIFSSVIRQDLFHRPFSPLPLLARVLHSLLGYAAVDEPITVTTCHFPPSWQLPRFMLHRVSTTHAPSITSCCDRNVMYLPPQVSDLFFPPFKERMGSFLLRRRAAANPPARTDQLR